VTESNHSLEQLEAKLDTLIRLFALAAIEDKKSQKDQILFLHKGGLGSKEIAELLDTTRNTVSVAISTAKKESKN
jgi:DNA-binding NarL/FixJ family response regulator